MKPKSTGLGKGLNAIFEIEELNIPKHTHRDSTINEIELSKIEPNPNQPRTLFDGEALDELAQSITRLGVIQPITVKSRGDGTYLIISGERRYRASKMAGLETIPAFVREANDQALLEMALVENIQREELSAIEVALCLQRLIEECNLTQETLAERVGKKRSTVTNYIRLLRLPAQVQSALSGDVITMGHARALLGLPTAASQIAMLGRIIKNHLSVRQTEGVVQAMLEAKPKAATTADREYPEYYTRLVERLEPLLGSKISIKRKASGEGKIVIDFDSEDQIQQIITNLENITK